MTQLDLTRRRICERQLSRLGDKTLGRHELLNVATALMLLLAASRSESTDDVEGHGCSRMLDGDRDRLIEAQGQLEWVRSHRQTGTIEELRRRMRFAAQELLLHL